MLGKTHLAVGISASLFLLQPHSLQGLLFGTVSAAVGSVISDIDVGSSESHKDADKIVTFSAVVLVGMIAVESIWHVGIYKMLMGDSNIFRIVLGAAGFLVLLAFGKEQPHRSFTHSILGLVSLSGCVAIVLPELSPYFFIAFVSHLCIDFLNKKGEQLLYPIERGFCLNLCSAEGRVNQLLFRIGSPLSVCLVLLKLVQIYF